MYSLETHSCEIWFRVWSTWSCTLPRDGIDSIFVDCHRPGATCFWLHPHSEFVSALDTRSDVFYMFFHCEVAKFGVPKVREVVDAVEREAQNAVTGRAMASSSGVAQFTDH